MTGPTLGPEHEQNPHFQTNFIIPQPSNSCPEANKLMKDSIVHVLSFDQAQHTFLNGEVLLQAAGNL